MSRARTVIIGASHWHLPLCAQAIADRHNVLGASDPDTSRVEGLSRLWGGTLHSSWEELLSAYDDIESRIETLREQEELDSIRPEVDGNRIQEVLGIRPGREVGEAYRFLLDLRLDEGIIGPEAAEQRLREWWAARG